eukprot:1179594-Prorocentrum_minimum.AAC.1
MGRKPTGMGRKPTGMGRKPTGMERKPRVWSRVKHDAVYGADSGDDRGTRQGWKGSLYWDQHDVLQCGGLVSQRVVYHRCPFWPAVSHDHHQSLPRRQHLWLGSLAAWPQVPVVPKPGGKCPLPVPRIRAVRDRRNAKEGFRALGL